MIGLYGLLMVPIGLLGAGAWIAMIGDSGGYWIEWASSNQPLPVFALLLLVLVSLIGSSVFLADQRMFRFRFLAERGVSPRAVWWSRQLVWMAVAALPAIVISLAALPMLPWLFRDKPPLYALLVGPNCVAVAYAAGQFCSMAFRSGILAAVFGAVLAGLVSIWAGLMLAGGVPWLWSVAPIPLVLLVATRVRTPNWRRERGGLRGRMPMTFAPALPAAAILTAVPFYRAYEIPVVSLGLSHQEYFRTPTAEEKATLEMYREAARLAEQGERTEAFELAIEASKRSACDSFDPFGERRAVTDMIQVGHMLLFSGSELDEAGKLDEAFSRYRAVLRISAQLRQRASRLDEADFLETTALRRLVDWSAAPGQTAERVGEAAGAVARNSESLPSRTAPVKSRYFVLRQVIAGDAEAMSQMGMSEGEIIRTSLWMKWMPWEQTRAHRLLNFLTVREIEQMRDVESAMANGVQVSPQFYTLGYDFFNPADTRDYWLRQHFLWSAKRGTLEALKMERQRRASRLVLAIEAWKLEHGRLPETLDALVGTYLDRVPLDPYSAELFRWFPEGVAAAIVPPDQRSWLEPEGVVPPNVPIVWIAGSLVDLREQGATLLERTIVRQSVYFEWECPTLELQIWQAGRALPLP
jgi:hypothetical protein